MEGEYLRKTLLEFAEYWNINNDIGSEEITKESIKEYIEFTKIDINRGCKYKHILDTINVRRKTEKDYYLLTELFVLLHNGKDCCDCTN
jgi:hypothetical protein